MIINQNEVEYIISCVCDDLKYRRVKNKLPKH